VRSYPGIMARRYLVTAWGGLRRCPPFRCSAMNRPNSNGIPCWTHCLERARTRGSMAAAQRVVAVEFLAHPPDSARLLPFSARRRLGFTKMAQKNQQGESTLSLILRCRPPQPSSGTREGRSWRDMHGENGGWVVAANCENRGGRTARFCYAEGMEMTRWSHQSASQPSKRGAQGRRLGPRRRKTGVGQIWLIWPNCAQFRFSFYIFILLICLLFILNPKFEFDTFYGFHP
jgi:hypothetical protein